MIESKQKDLDTNSKNTAKFNVQIPTDREKGFPLLQIREEYYGLNDLIVKKEVREKIETIISENKSAERLKSYGLRPKQKLLFCGPPGTGKTLTAKVISSTMGYPLVYVLFDSLLSSYLGETASNLRRIFEFIKHGNWVVLFDEFDIVGKKRDDPHEHGEVKRVVNNFMQMIDNYEGESIVIAATNHQHLLDIAIWRRFDDIIFFDLPDLNLRQELFHKYLRVLKRSKDLSIVALSLETENFSGADIAQTCEEALRKTILRGKDEITLNDMAWAINQQKLKKKVMNTGRN